MFYHYSELEGLNWGGNHETDEDRDEQEDDDEDGKVMDEIKYSNELWAQMKV